MNILRQGASFIFIGACLVLVDWSVFVALSASGVQTPIANLAGRVSGALLGFLANGRITFGLTGPGPGLGRRHFARFLVVWVVVTIVSTCLISEAATHLSLRIAWLGKPVVEAVLAIFSFLISRNWVYR